MFRYLLSILSLLIISPCVANIASSEYVNEMRDNVQAKIDKKADNANYTQNMVLQTDNSGNVIATMVGTDLFADNSIETIHLADGAVTNADLAGMIDITKLNLGTLPTSGKHMMIWNTESNEYVFEKYTTSILPDGYTQLEYIESTGTQYIDTGVVPSEHLSFDCIFQVPYTPKPDGYGNVFGARASSGVQEYQLSLFSEGMVGIGGRNSLLGFANFNKHHILFDGNTSVNIDGIFTTIITSVISEPVGTIVMFAIRSNNSIIQYEQTRIYKCSFGNIRNFIPAKNSAGVIGMYDTVTKTFFTNSGTGNFIAGPEI